MDFISNIWKASAKTKEEAKPEEAEEAKPETPKEPEKIEKQHSTGGGSDSGSTSGPDSDAPLTPESPKPETSDEKSATGVSIGVPLEGVSQKAIESAKSIGSFLFSVANKAGKTVTDTAKQIKSTVEETSLLAEFNKEQEAFLKNKQKVEVGILPWVGCVEEESVKQQILSLSADKRNFVRSPPSGVQFEFDMETISPVALALLQEDPELEKMRFELVPKLISETDFWRNYFYRVSLIKQSTQLSSLAHDKGSSSADSSSPSSRQSPSDDSNRERAPTSPEEEEGTPDSPSHEFVSDTYQGGKISEEEVKQGMKQLGMGDKAADDDWEKELQQELQEYEVVAGGAPTEDDPEWEKEMQEMLATGK